jgi:hypothetical protein
MAANPSTDSAGPSTACDINVKVKTLGQASYDLKLKHDVSVTTRSFSLLV